MDENALAALVGAGFDFLCTRRVSEVLEVTRLVEAVDALGDESRLAKLMTRLVAPARKRLLDRARASDLLLGVWLPAPVKDAIAALLGQPAPIPRKLIDAVVKDEKLRDNARAMLQEALSNVIHKAFAATPGGKGLRGMMSFGARAAGGLLGGLGEELQRQLEERVREFVDGGVALLQQRVAQKLASEETARLLGKRRRRMFLDLLERRESEVARFLDRTPWEIIEAMIPSVVVHNWKRDPVREAVRAEIAAAIEELSKQTIGELLDELGLRLLLREALVKSPLYGAFLEFQRTRS